MKLIIGLLTVLTTLLVSYSVAYHYKNADYEKLVITHASTLTINASLNSTIGSLRKEIEEMPNKQIDAVKGIDMELCKGLLGVKDILNLPSTTVLDVYPKNPNIKEVKKNEKPYVDIDAPLPPDLIKLLDDE